MYLPNLCLISAEKYMLPRTPLGEHKVKRRRSVWAWGEWEEVQEGVYTEEYQTGED